jgi:hypothetical protein
MKSRSMKLVAIFELLGGVSVVIGYAAVLSRGHFNPAWQVYPGLLFALLAITAGVLLLRSHPWGVPVSIVLQALQIVSLSIVPTFRYVALAGPVAQVIVATTGFYFELGGGGSFVAVPWSTDGTLGALGMAFSLGGGYRPQPLSESTFTIGINIAAAYSLWLLVFQAAAERREAHARQAISSV